jgi:hypothetical protein
MILGLSGLSSISLGQFHSIQVNSDTLTTCSEPSIALNPTNPDNLVIGVNNIYFLPTFDGGNT